MCFWAAHCSPTHSEVEVCQIKIRPWRSSVCLSVTKEVNPKLLDCPEVATVADEIFCAPVFCAQSSLNMTIKVILEVPVRPDITRYLHNGCWDWSSSPRHGLEGSPWIICLSLCFLQSVEINLPDVKFAGPPDTRLSVSPKPASTAVSLNPVDTWDVSKPASPLVYLLCSLLCGLSPILQKHTNYLS